MFKMLFSIAALCSCLVCPSQNIGVGTETPTEKLDINGNININGQVKLNGSAGAANQVLMKDAANNPVWGDMSAYKNIVVYDCNGVANSAEANNCANNWTVPAGVTSIIVECWGGGGGGSYLTAGGGGGYATAKFDVTPGSNLSFSVGALGKFGNPAVKGGNTIITIAGIFVQGYGGDPGVSGNPFNTSAASISQPLGGGYSATASYVKFFGMGGSPGGVPKLRFMAISTTEYAKVVEYGNGGDAAGFPNSGGRGGFKILSTTFNQTYAASFLGAVPGAGGGADGSGGSYGRGGRLIIHY